MGNSLYSMDERERMKTFWSSGADERLIWECLNGNEDIFTTQSRRYSQLMKRENSEIGRREGEIMVSFMVRS